MIPFLLRVQHSFKHFDLFDYDEEDITDIGGEFVEKTLKALESKHECEVDPDYSPNTSDDESDSNILCHLGNARLTCNVLST